MSCHVATVEVLNRNNVARERADANASLIAAAPELYAACAALMEFWDNGTPVRAGAEVVAELRAVMAKARGE